MSKRIRVLVIDDSTVQRELQVHLLNSDPLLEVVGTASDGREAVELVQRCRPDVVSMDFHMPGLDGAEVTRLLMENVPLPIVIVTGSSAPGEVAHTFQALEAGALTVVEKPSAPGSEAAQKYVETIKMMSEVKVVRRWPQSSKRGLDSVQMPAWRSTNVLVAIGASTGGPLALQSVLSGLPRDFAAPIAIVQHISPGFTAGLAEWLTDTCHFPVRVGMQGERLDPGQAYLAPEGWHMTVCADGQGQCRIELNAQPVENGHRPAVGALFRSVAAVVGQRAIGVLLTGMGCDGATELRGLRELGATTIVQTPESAAVAGMPGEAIRLGAALHVLPPEQIGGFLAALVHRPEGRAVAKRQIRGDYG